MYIPCNTIIAKYINICPRMSPLRFHRPPSPKKYGTPPSPPTILTIASYLQHFRVTASYLQLLTAFKSNMLPTKYSGTTYGTYVLPACRLHLTDIHLYMVLFHLYTASSVPGNYSCEFLLFI